MRTLKNNKSAKGFECDVKGLGTYDPSRKIIAVDFDGTLVINKYPYIENPNYKLIDYIKSYRNNYIWILWTCRYGNQLKLAVDYMKNEHGIEFDYINENAPWMIDKYGDTRKVYADIYIDDKARKEF